MKGMARRFYFIQDLENNLFSMTPRGPVNTKKSPITSTKKPPNDEGNKSVIDGVWPRVNPCMYQHEVIWKVRQPPAFSLASWCTAFSPLFGQQEPYLPHHPIQRPIHQQVCHLNLKVTDVTWFRNLWKISVKRLTCWRFSIFAEREGRLVSSSLRVVH